MTHNPIKFDPKLCSERVQDALEESMKQAEKHRYEFITPEILLYNIISQPEFLNYCSKYQVDHARMLKSLTLCNSRQDKVPENEKYKMMMSEAFYELFGIIFHEDISKQGGKVDIPQVLAAIYDLSEASMAQYLLRKHLGRNPEDWMEAMTRQYEEAANPTDGTVGAEAKALLDLAESRQRKAKPTLPEISGFFPHLVKAEAYINGKKVDLGSMEIDESLGKMMASTNFLIGALSAMERARGMANNGNQAKDGENNGGEEADDLFDEDIRHTFEQEHEPWEELVRCLSDEFPCEKPLIGREKELSRCIRILCRKDKNNPLFIGEPGVGKTALIYGLAEMISLGNVPDWLKCQKVYILDLASLVAGASYHGEFERRMKMVMEGAKKRKNCILCIDEIHGICESTGGNSTMNAAEILKPYLEDGSIRFIGCTTYKDYNKSIANRKALARRFGLIDVKEPSVEESVGILHGVVPTYERHHGVRYTDEASRYAVEKSAELIHDRFLPDKAIDIIDEAGAYLQQHPLLNREGKPKAPRFQKVGKDVVKLILTDVCRIDAKALSSESNSSLKNLGERISSEIYGQDEAVRQVARAVMMAKAGLTEPGKPMASLLFVGPTGVGKTEVCKVLAKELGVELVRFDMSEYAEKHTVSKLIGSPAGYVGYEEGGQLTDAVRKTPNMVLLLDEIEKAHSDIYNILLQVMDYAQLTDNKGNKADFKNVIIIMTSNAGAQFAGQAAIGFAGGQSKGKAMLESVKKTFKPEFINRLSATVVFNDMDRTMAAMILDKKLRQLSKRLEAKQVVLEVQKEAKDFLLEAGFSPLYGAREMDRAIQQHLMPLLMDEILFGKLVKGGNVSVGRKDRGLKIETSSILPSAQ